MGPAGGVLRVMRRAAWTMLLVGVWACSAPEEPTEAAPGLPLPGITEEEQSAFAAGQAAFNRPFTPEEGLGPLFNQDRCSSCHDLPTSGGHGAEPVTKATHFTVEDGCTPLPEQGGDLRQQVVTPLGRAAGLTPETIPPGVTHASEVRAPAVYGLGLIEAVAETDILTHADPEDRDGNGISGRANFDAQGRAGRFGRRAQHATLFGFIEEATRLELGLTTPDHPDEELANGVPVPSEADPASDPEVDQSFLQSLDDYVRYLAPPGRRWPQEAAARADIEEGEQVFAFAGCPDCHVPTFTTAPGDNTALSGKTFRLYSDLLLHDMGRELSGPCTPGTTPTEWKTARLVGLAHRTEFLHDGRAQRISRAIELHGGEAERSRDLFMTLTPQARDQLIAFLQSL